MIIPSYNDCRHNYEKVLNIITRNYPIEIWDYTKKFLNQPYSTQQFFIEKWLRGPTMWKKRTGSIEHIPKDKLWNWIDEDKEKNALHTVACILPPFLASKTTREFLKRYGNNQKLRNELIKNFCFECWTGSASHHYIERKNEREN